MSGPEPRYFASVVELPRDGRIVELVPPEGMHIEGWMEATLAAQSVMGTFYAVPGLAIIYKADGKAPNREEPAPDTTPSHARAPQTPTEPPVTVPATPAVLARARALSRRIHAEKAPRKKR